MQIRRLTAAAAAVLALAGTAGCRTAPNVAAYVGDETVTVSELDAAVEARTADEAVAEFAATDPDEFTRRVLTSLVEDEVHTAAAERYGIEIDDAEVRDRIEVLLGDQDPEEVFGGLAQQGISREEIFLTVRQQLIRLRIAQSEGLADGLEDEALQAAYEEVRGQSAEYDLGYITVPTQAAADAAVARLEEDPAAYAALAERYAGDFTIAEPETRAVADLPGPLVDQVTTAEPGDAFSVPVEATGGIVVGFVADARYPSFEEVRPQLEQEALAAADGEIAGQFDELRDDLDIEVNPRYGEVGDGAIEPADGGVVDFLDVAS